MGLTSHLVFKNVLDAARLTDKKYNVWALLFSEFTPRLNTKISVVYTFFFLKKSRSIIYYYYKLLFDRQFF